MPNFDTGHYFLTTLAPIKRGTTLDERGVNVSYEQNVRALLAKLPTALQSPATEAIGINSPFARNLRTHFSRFMVLEDVIYNGRTRSDAIISSIFNKDPIVPQEVDRLNCAYLMFTADFDAVLREGDALPEELAEAEQDNVRNAYARRLWDTMQAELQEIYSNCVGFDTVKTADDFADYIRRCQVETTMPFNDYWLKAPNLARLPVTGLLAAILVPLVPTLLALVSWIFHMDSLPLLGLPSGATFIFGAIATAVATWLVYRYVMSHGEQPMPPGEYADLPAVLKSLYLQQTFSEFVIDAQGKNAAELHQAFGEFVTRHQPNNKMSPTQVPGVISIKRDNAIHKSEQGA